ncbi:MAG TPA: hypothetical protein VGG85_05950 [Terracidiphilus sp.]|jgi:hypothetical protein
MERKFGASFFRLKSKASGKSDAAGSGAVPEVRSKALICNYFTASDVTQEVPENADFPYQIAKAL